MQKHTLTLWTDELIFARRALVDQRESYGEAWRASFIRWNAAVASVYLPAIRANRDTINQMDRLLAEVSVDTWKSL